MQLMAKLRCFLWLWVGALLPVFCQAHSVKPQVSTIADVRIHENGGEPRQYDVSLQVRGAVYVVLYTPPSGSRGIEEMVGQNLVVLIGSNTITFTKLGRTVEVPILRRETRVVKRGIDWSRAPGEYFSQKLQHLSETLDLTTDQQLQIKPILEHEAGEASQITANPVLTKKDKMKKFEKIVGASDRELKPILSSAQWQTLQTMREEEKRELRTLLKGKEPG